MAAARQSNQSDTANRVSTNSTTRRGGLGRGLDALIPAPEVTDRASSHQVPIESISPNPYQPRMSLDPNQLDDLSKSIRTHGIIQPLVVAESETAGRFVMIAGERRWRAARQVGLSTVPVVIKDVVPQAMLELALVENVIRADLSPLEEATAYRQLIDEFGLTQHAVATRVGRSRVSVTNTLRLLSAPDGVQAALNAGDITEGHARALLGLGNAADQLAALEVVRSRQLTVRQTEALVRRWLEQKTDIPSAPLTDQLHARLANKLEQALGTRVTFKQGRGGGGSLSIYYHSDDELNALYDRLVGDDPW